MKQIYFFWSFIFICYSLLAQAQNPSLIHYQGAVRNQDGTPFAHRNITVRLSIVSDFENGKVIYYEVRSTTTNALGLYNIQINAVGAVETSTPIGKGFDEIDWGNGAKYLRVEIDLHGKTDFQFAGVSQIVSVPYAMYAASGGSSGYNYWAQQMQNKGKSVQEYLKLITQKPNAVLDSVKSDLKVYSAISGLLTINNGKGSVLSNTEIRLDEEVLKQSILKTITEAILLQNQSNTSVQALKEAIYQQDTHAIANVSKGKASAVEQQWVESIQSLEKTTELINHQDGTFSFVNEKGNKVFIDMKGTLVDNQDGTYTFTDASGKTTTMVTNAVKMSEMQKEGHPIGKFVFENGVEKILNESITHLSIKDHILSFTNEQKKSTNLDLTSYLDNTDQQQLILENNQLTISGGNTVTLPSPKGETVMIQPNDASIVIQGKGTPSDPYKLDINSNGVNTNELAPSSVTQGKIASNAVTSGKLASKAVTPAKIEPSTVPKRVLFTNASGVVEWASPMSYSISNGNHTVAYTDTVHNQTSFRVDVPVAKYSTVGLVRPGNGLTIDAEGTLRVATMESMPTHIITQGTGISVEGEGTAINPYIFTNTYTLPVASAQNIGAVKKGEGVEIAGDGTLTLALGNGLYWNSITQQVQWGGQLNQAVVITTVPEEDKTIAIKGLKSVEGVKISDNNRVLVQDSQGVLGYVTRIFEPFVFEGVRGDLTHLGSTNYAYQNNSLIGANVKAITVFTGTNFTRVQQSRLSLDTTTGTLRITGFGGNDASNIAIQWFR